MSPLDIDGFAEAVSRSITQWDGDPGLSDCMLEADLSRRSEGHADSHVLLLRLLRIDSCGIEVKRFPLGVVLVVIESGCFYIHVEVGRYTIGDEREGGTALLPVQMVVSNPMRVSMPGFPQLIQVGSRAVDLI